MSIRNWHRKHHGERKQAEVIDFIETNLDMFSLASAESSLPMDLIYKQCAATCKVSKATARRWWKSYLHMGELPHETNHNERKMKAKYKWLPSKKAKLSDTDIQVLQDIVLRRPHAYIDEIALEFGKDTGKYISPSTLWRYITNELGLTLQVLTTRAKQQCEISRSRFTAALSFILQNCPERLVMVDETHKDRNAARRRRGWGRRNARGGIKLAEWFKNTVRYTLIAVADINGFIECACETVDRRELSDEGAAGTVDREYFTRWVKEKLCPVLGRFDLGEPRSVVLLDNTSTHMTYEVVDAIHATGAIIIYSSPYSPDLNPIENFFSMYKAQLKKIGEGTITRDWTTAHLNALGCVSRDNGIRYFRSCGIPGAWELFTTEELIEYDNSH